MRVTLVGASPLAVATARALCARNHEVVLIDRSPEKIDALSGELDCGFITGDGSRPGVLEEVGPEQTDFLFAMSDSDEANILAALVGRSLGFARVVPKIEDPDLEPICTELGLDDVIVPDVEVGRQLVDLVEGREAAELMTVVRSGLRFLAFEVPDDVVDGEGLGLPKGARLIARTRGDQSVLADPETELSTGDEVVILAEEAEVEALHERFTPDREDADAEDDA